MLIPVRLADGEPVIMMDDSLLVKKEGVVDDDNEHTTWTEYWLGDKLVHRSAHVTLKKMPAMFGEAARIGG
jgi:hypothetical protein